MCSGRWGRPSARDSGACSSVVQHPLMPRIVLVSMEVQVRL